MPHRPQPSQTAPAEGRHLGLWFAAARRTGLLAATPPAVWHTLSAVLSFTTSAGDRAFTLEQMALTLGEPLEGARERLAQLTATVWQGEPPARLEAGPQGEVRGAALPGLELLSEVTVPEVADRPASCQEEGGEDGGDLPAALLAVGLNPSQVGRLLLDYPLSRIRRQLTCLPRRQARNPAALLLRAIQEDWEPPQEEA